MNYHVKTAILIIGFKRKDTLEQVLSSVKMVNPKKIYIALDGPREKNEDDFAKTGDVHKLCDSIDWCADVRKKFRTENAGCKRNVEEAISWAFETEERLIILEDDIVASVSFYRFCDEMLEFFVDNQRVWNICGYSPIDFSNQYNASYYFSSCGGIWGWATWKDRWEKRDTTMEQITNDNIKKKVISLFKRKAHGKLQYTYYLNTYKEINEGISQGWDYTWSFSGLKNDSYILMPIKSLVQNVGFGNDSLHGGRPSSPFAQVKANEMDFPIKHLKTVETNMNFDAQVMKMRFRNGNPLWYAYLGNIYRRYYPSKDIKVVAYLKKIIKSKL